MTTAPRERLCAARTRNQPKRRDPAAEAVAMEVNWWHTPADTLTQLASRTGKSSIPKTNYLPPHTSRILYSSSVSDTWDYYQRCQTELGLFVCVCTSVSLCVCACACARACVYVCVKNAYTYTCKYACTYLQRARRTKSKHGRKNTRLTALSLQASKQQQVLVRFVPLPLLQLLQCCCTRKQLSA